MGPRQVQFVTADAALRRLQAVGEWLGKLPPSQEVLVLAPTRGAADDLLRRFAPRGRGLFGVHRLTLPQLAADLATSVLAADARAPMTALASEALAARCVERCGRRLTYFAPVAQAPGLPKALRSTLRELRLFEIDPGELLDIGLPGKDLATLSLAYEEELERWALTDEAGLLRRAARRAESGLHRLLDLPTVFLDLSPRSLVERRLLRALVRRTRAVCATAMAGDRPGLEALEEIFGHPPENLSDLDDPAEEAPSSGPRPTPRRLHRLRRHIFRPGATQEDTPPAEDDQSVVLLSAPGEGRECVEITRRIRALAADGLPFDRMAVLLRDPDTYIPLLEDALRRAGVPAFFTRGTVRPHPAGRAFLALLACAGENLAASRFAEYLSLGQVPATDDEGKPPQVEVPWVFPQGEQLVFKSLLVPSEDDTEKEEPHESDETPVIAGTLQAPQRWERLLVDAAVLGGRDRWQRRLDGLEAEIRLRLRHLESEDRGDRRRLETQLDRLGYLKRFALPLIDDLAALPESATWGRWLEALAHLASRALRQPERVIEVLSELHPMERVGPVGLDEVRRVLEERLTFLRAEPPNRRYARVFVATLDEARGRAFEAVFLPGLAEGIFPRRAHEDPLLLDVHRRRLKAPLPTQRQRIDEERLLLRIAAGAAERRLVVTWPNLDVLHGRARVPSFYALDLLRATEGRLPDLRQLEERAARGSESILGWPAPRRAETAIDAAEFDLSVLEPLLRGTDQDVTSRGRYLVHTNERLARALRVRFRRWQDKLSSADGLVHATHPKTAEALAGERLRKRSYSPTALQNFAACPYRFLLASVHRLRPRDEVAWLEQLDPLTRGSLFHEVQFELFRTLEEHQLLPIREDDLSVVLEFCDRTLEAVAARYEEELAPAIPRVWRTEIENLGTDLRGWVQAVASAREPWRPAHFEFGFGLPDRLPEQNLGENRHEAMILDGKRLRGAIDLVETDDQRGVLRVTDHKTGVAPFERHLVVGRGEILQPLLYALAAEVHLARTVESGRLFYCTRRGGYEVREVPLTDQNRVAVGQVLEIIDNALASASLPAVPREGACRFCDFRMVCGPLEEVRSGRKVRANAGALAGLAFVRNSP